MAFHTGVDRERADFRGSRRIEMQCSATGKTIAGINDGKIPDILRHFKLGTRQHDAFRGVPVDDGEQRMNVFDASLAYGQLAGGDRRFLGSCGGNHLDSARTATNRVPMASPAMSLLTTPGRAPGAIATSVTPPSNASVAAFNLASMPPDATPDAISPAPCSGVRYARVSLFAPRTPSTSVRNSSLPAWKLTAQATAIWSALTL